MVSTEAVRTEAETKAPVQVLVCGDVATCQSASPLHPLKWCSKPGRRTSDEHFTYGWDVAESLGGNEEFSA
jgi:hypothetical protein